MGDLPALWSAEAAAAQRAHARHLRRWAAFGSSLAALVAGLLVGCGDHDSGPAPRSAVSAVPTPSPREIVVAAFDRTVKARSLGFAEQVVVHGGGRELAVSASGAADLVHRTVAMTLTRPGAGSIDLRSVGGALYVKSPYLAQQAGVRKPWLVVPVSAPTEIAGSFAGFEPAKVLAQARGLVPADVQETGTAEVRGAAMTRVRAKIGAQRLTGLSLLGQAGLGGAGLTGLRENVPVDLYTDSQGFLRRVLITLRLPGGATAAVVADFFAVNEPVSVDAPPAGDVAAGGDFLHGG
jgi:hypothetical protein